MREGFPTTPAAAAVFSMTDGGAPRGQDGARWKTYNVAPDNFEGNAYNVADTASAFGFKPPTHAQGGEENNTFNAAHDNNLSAFGFRPPAANGGAGNYNNVFVAARGEVWEPAFGPILHQLESRRDVNTSHEEESRLHGD
jgi:hypothetical protein